MTLDESPPAGVYTGMKLPNVDRVQIPQAKAVEYLLSPTHPEGAGKAEFFAAMGFRHEEWQVLAGALRQVARDFPVTKSMTSPHGRKYIAEVYYRRRFADTEWPGAYCADGVDC